MSLLARAKYLKRLLILAFVSAMAAGCDITTGFVVASGTMGTIISEDKLPTDYIAEWATGMDCNTIRRSRDKGPLCRAPKEELIERPRYCYRELGGVTCYREPNPTASSSVTVN